MYYNNTNNTKKISKDQHLNLFPYYSFNLMFLTCGNEYFSESSFEET